MSRIGKKPISLPAGVDIKIEAGSVHVKGPKGALSLVLHPEVKASLSEGVVSVEKTGASREAKAVWGTTQKLIANMVEGVTRGFQKQLELNGVGFRMNVAGKKLNLALGFSHPVEVAIPEGLSAKIEANVLTIEGIDKQLLGQFAADVRGLKPVEPYKGKGFKYVGEHVRRKEGKKAAA